MTTKTSKLISSNFTDALAQALSNRLLLDQKAIVNSPVVILTFMIAQRNPCGVMSPITELTGIEQNELIGSNQSGLDKACHLTRSYTLQGNDFPEDVIWPACRAGGLLIGLDLITQVDYSVSGEVHRATASDIITQYGCTGTHLDLRAIYLERFTA